jgi:hypothetical protein
MPLKKAFDHGPAATGRKHGGRSRARRVGTEFLGALASRRRVPVFGFRLAGEMPALPGGSWGGRKSRCQTFGENARTFAIVLRMGEWNKTLSGTDTGSLFGEILWPGTSIDFRCLTSITVERVVNAVLGFKLELVPPKQALVRIFHTLIKSATRWSAGR